MLIRLGQEEVEPDTGRDRGKPSAEPVAERRHCDDPRHEHQGRVGVAKLCRNGTSTAHSAGGPNTPASTATRSRVNQRGAFTRPWSVPSMGYPPLDGVALRVFADRLHGAW